jgi:tRNA-binding EMAP/Myf-like protein
MRTLLTLLALSLLSLFSTTAFQPAGKLYRHAIHISGISGMKLSSAEPVPALLPNPLEKAVEPAEPVPFERYRNPAYPPDQLEQLWKDRDSMMTIGGAGVSQKHKSNLNNLLNQHPVVRIKLASDRRNAHDVGRELMADETISLKADLLEVRSLALMFGRKQGGSNGEGGGAALDDIRRVEIRVGKVLSVERHPEADGLYIEQVPFVPYNPMYTMYLITLCTLQPYVPYGPYVPYVPYNPMYPMYPMYPITLCTLCTL